jgi:hypothetical protein
MKHLPLVNALILGLLAMILGFFLRQPLLWLAVGLLCGILTALLTNFLIDRSIWRGWPLRRRLLLLVFAEALVIIYLVIPGKYVHTPVYILAERRFWQMQMK